MANTLRFKRGLLAGLPSAAVGEPLFTTDTFDLYIGTASGTQKYQKFIASGTTSQLLRGDGSLLTMPIVLTSPSNGQVLKYNGTSWVNDSDAGITGSGTTNYLPKFTGASTLGNSLVFDNGTNVGIGTSSPSYKFEVYHPSNDAVALFNSANANGGHIRFAASGTVKSYIGCSTGFITSAGVDDLGLRAEGAIRFATNGVSTDMMLDSSGNLGLGVVPSAWSSLWKAIQVQNAAFASLSSSYAFVGQNWYNDGASKFLANGRASLYQQSDGVHSWYYTASNSSGAGAAITFTQAMTLDASGRLGIGTTSPVVSLDVRGEVAIAYNALYGLRFYNDARSNWSSIGNTITGSSDSNLVFKTATGVMTYTGQGRLLLGSTSDNGLRFQVTGDGYFSGNLGIGVTSPSAALEIYTLNDPTAIFRTFGDFNVHFRGQTNGLTQLFSIRNSGTNAVFLNTQNSVPLAFGVSAGSTGGSVVQQMLLNSSGNLGLGVTPSAWLNTIKTIQIGSVGGAFITGNTVGGGSTLIGLNGYFDNATSTWIYGTSHAASYYQQTAGQHRWYNAPSGTAGNAITFTQAMTLDASGRLGIGTTTITAPLTVAGTSDLAWSASTSKLQISRSGSVARLQNYESGSAASLSLQWDGGNVGIGTTSPTNLLTLYNASSAIYSQWVQSGTGTGSTDGLRIGLDASSNGIIDLNEETALITSVNGSVRMRINSGGDIWFKGASSSTGYEAAFENSNSIFSIYGSRYGGTGKAITLWATGLSESMRINYTNNVLIGTTADAGYKLDVNGTMRVSGASTFGGNSNLSLNQNSQTFFKVQNTTSGTAAYSSLIIQSDASSGSAEFGKVSSLYTTYKILTASSSYIYNATAGNLVLLNDFASGSIVMAAGGSSTAHFTIASTGAATFSSSVTATNLYSTGASNFATSGGNVGIGTASPTAKFHVFATENLGGTAGDNTILTRLQNSGGTGGNNVYENNWAYRTGAGTNWTTWSIWNGISVDASFTTPTTSLVWHWREPFAGKHHFGNESTNVMTIGPSNVGIGTTSPSYKLDVTGSARVSDAIAIGTTPDTNLPFKILKNINSTVGIRFENTSTGASSFTGYQFGTDVSGGTAFTNFLYASSGVAETGVYKPNGTALINTGSGGLNFLAVSQPIRFFTSTGTGTLRAAITNDGDFTQYNGTNPSASTTDAFRMYSADITAGNAAPHFRTENGGIIKLYQQTTGVTSATYIGGAGTGLTDSDTFDGYTIAQIVKALRNAGLLA